MYIHPIVTQIMNSSSSGTITEGAIIAAMLNGESEEKMDYVTIILIFYIDIYTLVYCNLYCIHIGLSICTVHG